MITDQAIWTMIKDLLTVFYTYYLPENIFYAFQNNYKLPQVDDFIIITRRNIFQNGLPLRNYDIANQKKLSTGFGDWEYQVDLYGDNSDTSANILYTFINSADGSNYLIPNQMGIGKVKEPINLTRSNDRERYMKRYTLTFTAINISTIQIPLTGIELNDVTITYEELT